MFKRVRPFSNLWHALWISLAFVVSLAIWVFTRDLDIPRGYEGNTSYLQDVIFAAPTATIFFGLLAISMWIAWWVERKRKNRQTDAQFGIKPLDMRT
jgi:hypothetical protein